MARRDRAGTRKADVRADPPGRALGHHRVAVAFLGLFIVLPLVNVFAQAFAKGLDVYFAALTRRPMRSPRSG